MNDDPQHARVSARERYRGYTDPTGSDGRHSMLASIVALSVFIGIGALSIWQATEPTRARDQIEIGVAAITDIDTYLDETHETLEAAAAEGDTVQVTLPGFPLDVSLTRQEVLESEPELLREIILERSAALVYVDGLDAFDRTGEQSLGLLSSEWLLDRLIAFLAGPWHSRAGWTAAICAIAIALSAPFIFQRRGAAGGLRSLGFATLVGAVPGLFFAGAATYWFGRGNTTDPFSSAVRSILEDFFLVPRQDYLLVTGAGALFAASGYIIGILEPRFGDQSYEGDAYDDAYGAYDDEAAWENDGYGASDEAEDLGSPANVPAARAGRGRRGDSEL